MGSYDGAETCELVGLFILSQMQHLNINVGLYRDDGLAVCSSSPRQIENIKKEICNIFKQNNLSITIEANHKTVNFLDITMDLRTGIYKPFMKPNNTPLYVHRNSNHPPTIIKNIPENINRRLSSISANEAAFKESIPPYQTALKDSGYDFNLKYNPPQVNENSTGKKKRTRNRNITWFNPPYSQNVKTNVGKKFLKLIDTCFPPNHKLHKLLNRNTIKVSYRCMPNIKQAISAHNSSVTKKSTPQQHQDKTCNCRNKASCPVDGNCLTEGIIYQAIVTRTDNNSKETYIGLTENSFKTRFNGHNSTFRNESRRNATTLSQHIWKMKDNNISYTLNWKIIAKGKPYSTSSKSCNLCNKEKFFIICRPQMATLNARSELVGDCKHRRKHLLCSI